MSRHPLDRSAAFTALLDLDPSGFGKTSEPETGQTVTTFLDDFHESGHTNMYEYARQWLFDRHETVRAVRETARQRTEAGAKAQATSPERCGNCGTAERPLTTTVVDWRTDKLCDPCAESFDWSDWHYNPDSRTYTHKSGAEMATMQDRERGGAGTEATRDTISAAEGQADPPLTADERGFWEAGAREASDAEARGPRGPSASYLEWLAEGREDATPTERQLEDWNIHNDHADGYEPGYEEWGREA